MTAWIRLYSDTLRDPRVQKLEPHVFKFWINLLCVAANNDGAIPPIDDLKAVLRMRLDHLKSGLKRLLEGSLIVQGNDGLVVADWGKMSYKSDSSTERSRRHRARKKAASAVTRNVACNATGNATGNVAATQPTTNQLEERGKAKEYQEVSQGNISRMPAKDGFDATEDFKKKKKEPKKKKNNIIIYNPPYKKKNKQKKENTPPVEASSRASPALAFKKYHSRPIIANHKHRQAHRDIGQNG